MSSRKITIKINEKNLLGVLEDLKKLKSSRPFWNRSELKITLDLEDKKETYEYLSKSRNIIDWSLGDSIIPDLKTPSTSEPEEPKEEESKEEVVETPKPIKPESKKPERFVDYVSKFSGTSDWTNLAFFIEASWRVAKKSPGVIFGTPLFKSTLAHEYEEIKKNIGSSERLILGKVLESYYYNFDYMDAVEDTIGKLRASWKMLPKYESLTSVSICLYKNT